MMDHGPDMLRFPFRVRGVTIGFSSLHRSASHEASNWQIAPFTTGSPSQTSRGPMIALKRFCVLPPLGAGQSGYSVRDAVVLLSHGMTFQTSSFQLSSE